MTRQIFRQAALDRLGASEALDHLVELVLPRPLEAARDAALALRARLGRRRPAEQYRRVRTPTVLQMEATECGAAALGSVLGYHGLLVTLEELREACGVSRDGSKASSIVKAAREYGLLAKGYTKQLDGLRTLPLPCIVFWGFEHFVVVEGFGSDRVFLNDPAIGPRSVTAAEFDASFTGVVLVFEPGPEFRPGGAQPSLYAAFRRRLAGAERSLILLLLASFLLLVPGLLLPLATGAFVDRVLLEQNGSWVWPLLAALTALVIMQGGLTWLQSWLLLWIENRLSVRGSQELFAHMLRLPVGFFSQRLAGDIATRVSLVDGVAQTLTGSLASSALAAVLVLAYLVMMASYDLVLTAIGLVGAILNAVALRASARRRGDAQRRMLQDSGTLMGTTLGALRTIETVKASGAESDAFARWAGYQARVVNAQGALETMTQPMAAVPGLVTGLTVAATLVLGGLRVIDGSLSAGMLVAFHGLLLGFLAPFGELVQLGATLQLARGDLLRLDDVLRAPADPQVGPIEPFGPDAAADQSAPRLRGQVGVRGLTFGYSRRDPPLIDGLDLTIRAGARVALVGSSASGKSTVARLVAGLYQPWAGQILLDGTPRPDLPRPTIARSLGMVDQEIVLFGGTVRENIALWDDRITAEAVERAARDAAIHDDIMARSGGYDAQLDEQGHNLSGGQRQRIEIARALAGDPSILVLDEATSALDPVTEGVVMANLKRRGCTCLIVAHRLSTIRDADEILVLAAGRVVQRGTHSELHDVPGEYRRLLEAGAPDPDSPGCDAGQAMEALGSRGLTSLLSSSGVSGANGHLASDAASWGGVGDASDADTAPDESARSDPVMAAMRLVGDALGIRFRPAAPGTPDQELLDGIARASRVRMRHVHLRDGWWRTDSGPLLASRADDGTPVVLLPRRPGQYVLVDPADGRRVPVTPELASTLASTAVMLYRPFPDRALGGWDLLCFGLFGGRGDLLVMLAVGIAASLLALALPIAIGVAFDSLLPGGLRNELLLLGLGLVAAALASGGLTIAQGIAMVRAESRSDAAIQAAVWDRLLGLPAAFFRAFDVGDLGERAMAIASIRQVASSTALTSAVGVGYAVSSLGLLLTYDVRLGVLALVLVALYASVTAWGGTVKLRRQRAVSDLAGRVLAQALELIGGIIRLRVAGAEARGLARWSQRFHTYRTAMCRAGLASIAMMAWTAAFPILVSLVLFIAVAPGGFVTLDVGGFVAVAAAFAQCIGAAGGLAGSALTILEAVPLYERARPILRARPESSSTLAHPGRLTGSVRLEHVSFRYSPNGPLVLDDVSLEIRPGECLAVVGPSGSGKSTLLRLLLGFERPERGRVLYDGQDLATLDAREVRRQIGVVLQNGAVTADTILRNIVGAAPLTVQDAWEAARLAGLDGDIRLLPMGMYTRVPEGGASFSGGQRQRLMIARALVRRPRLVFFDEATSALDNATQAIVSASLNALGASQVLIAHRLSTVQHADRIVVLSGGRVVQNGGYADLAEQGGLFSDLSRRQVV